MLALKNRCDILANTGISLFTTLKMSATSTKKSLDGFDHGFLVSLFVCAYLFFSILLSWICDSLYERTIENINIEMVDRRTLDFLYWAIHTLAANSLLFTPSSPSLGF